ncbi:MAG TPA: TadE family type IV pilus minor pilin [Pseudonocardia sp.]|jgi:hypothetical protein
MFRTDDRGAVTVEAALALASLMLVLALAIAAISAVGAQLRCMDAAREAARLVARGELDRASRAAGMIAPSGARVEIVVRGDEVTVTVASAVVGRLPGLLVSARAMGVLEPGTLDSAAAGPEEPALTESAGSTRSTDPVAPGRRAGTATGAG